MVAKQRTNDSIQSPCQALCKHLSGSCPLIIMCIVSVLCIRLQLDVTYSIYMQQVANTTQFRTKHIELSL